MPVVLTGSCSVKNLLYSCTTGVPPLCHFRIFMDHCMNALAAKSVGRQNMREKKRAVRCVDNGVVYASSRDAAEILATQGRSVIPEAIAAVCRGKQKSTGGFRWEYAG